MTGVLVAVVLPVAGASPAGAAPAPLVTQDGIGLRVDETALTGPALTEIENALDGFAENTIRDDVLADPPFSGVQDADVSMNLDLALDFIAPGTGFPDGGLAVHADLENIFIDFEIDHWWHPVCHIFVEPDTGTVDVSAKADKSQLPGTPAVVNPVEATWDDDPAVDWSGIDCQAIALWQGFLNAWNSFWGDDPQSTASKIEDKLDGTLQDMIDDLWAQHVAPVLTSLEEGFGITVAQLRADDHGLIVTGDVDATGGVTIPGVGGPFDVSGAEDSGADGDVNALLANRTSAGGDSHVIASVHPNVVNQAAHALIGSALAGQYGTYSIPASIEEVLLLPEDRGLYPDGDWTVQLTGQTPPHTEPTGAEGAPQLQIPQMTLTFFNSGFSLFFPVATFSGNFDGLDLITEVRAGSSNWGPGFSTANSSLSVTRTQADANASQVSPQASEDVLPYAKINFENFNDQIFVRSPASPQSTSVG